MFSATHRHLRTAITNHLAACSKILPNKQRLPLEDLEQVRAQTVLNLRCAEDMMTALSGLIISSGPQNTKQGLIRKFCGASNSSCNAMFICWTMATQRGHRRNDPGPAHHVRINQGPPTWLLPLLNSILRRCNMHRTSLWLVRTHLHQSKLVVLGGGTWG